MMIGADIASQAVCLGGGDVKVIPFGIFHDQVFPDHTFQLPEG